jgi:energy-coupling factor transporter ATP-binding protein EcfA2
MPQFIYTMSKVRKAHGDKVILDDVTLAFLPGAKIGVVGPNGAGKSSVLNIMAGLDQPRMATRCSRNLPASACSSRSPSSTRPRTCAATSRTACARSATLCGATRSSTRRWAPPTPTSTRSSPSRARCWTPSRLPTPGSSTASSSRRWTRYGYPPATRTSRSCPEASAAGSRSAGCCCPRPTSCCWTSRPTTSTPSRSTGWRSTSPPTRARCWRSPTTGTSSTTWPSGSSSSTAARPTPMRGTTRPTWRPSSSG